MRYCHHGICFCIIHILKPKKMTFLPIKYFYPSNSHITAVQTTKISSLLKIYNLTEYSTRQARRNALEEWRRTGGVMVIGYDMFRLLATGKGIRHKATKVCYSEALLDPGDYAFVFLVLIVN